MKIFRLFRSAAFQCLCTILIPLATQAQTTQCDASTLEDFFSCYGGQAAFGTHSVAAITTFIQAEDAIKTGNYTQAKTLVDDLFTTYPKGTNQWWNIFNAPNGANVGTPHAYYGLRMMEDVVDFGLNGNPNVKAKKVNMKIVLVACSEGIQPTNNTELKNGTGTFVTHEIDPLLKADDYRIVRQSLDFFTKYITAITKGSIEVNIEFVELNDLCLPVKVTTTKPYLAYDNIELVWGEMNQVAKDSADWWMVIYPSHVPEFPDFDNESFITGGMGSDYKGGPVFIADDKWIVRKPAHLGKGNYSDIERRIYLPQWLQHEFFHHLYRIYPDLKLEVNGHDWFNLNFWPPDFEGQFETDYYSETLHKRLQLDCVPLATKLITRKEQGLEALYNTFTMNELLGLYSKDIIQNQWHEGDIISENGKYYWKNKANVKWEVTPDFTEGKLVTGGDSPYPGKDFFLELYRTVEGDFVPGAVALKYQGEFYKKRFNLLRETAPMEIALGEFERVPNLNAQHTGELLKTAGNISWKNDAGGTWMLVPNTDEEYLNMGNDSPTPGEIFQLVLVESDCGLHALGFKYLDHYYWKPKRSLSNGSPGLVNGITDLELKEDFGSYSINLANVFNDPEGDSLLLFVTSEDSALISANINAEDLILSGNETGATTIYVMALDVNGGLAVDEFNVNVKPVVSKLNEGSHDNNIVVFPSITHNFITVEGATIDHKLELISIANVFQQSFQVISNQMNLDLSHLASGLYLLMVKDTKTGSTRVEKVFKY